MFLSLLSSAKSSGVLLIEVLVARMMPVNEMTHQLKITGVEIAAVTENPVVGLAV